MGVMHCCVGGVGLGGGWLDVWNWSMIIWCFMMVEENFKAQYFFIIITVFWLSLFRLMVLCPLGARP